MNLIKYLVEGLPIDKIIANDDRFYRSAMKIEGELGANESKDFDLTVSTRGIGFLVLAFTGNYTTFSANSTSGDSTVCPLSFALKNNNGRVYIQKPIRMDLLMTPGRTASLANGTPTTLYPSSQLMFPGMFFATLWRGKDVITATVKNNANATNSFEVAFHGLWLVK